MSESRQGRLHLHVPLHESVLVPGRHEVEVTCVCPGLSRNGNYYPPATLAEAVPLFEDARCFIDHSAAAQRSVRDLCGRFHDARLREDGAVCATLRVVGGHDGLWGLIEEAVETQSDLVGLSIDALATTHQGEVEGKRARIVEAITALQSVDVVPRAAAKGSFDTLREADEECWRDQGQPYHELAAELAAAAAAGGARATDQQRTVQAGVVHPTQFGPSVAENIPGGQLQLGGVRVEDRVPGQDGAVVASGEPPSTTAPAAPPAQLAEAARDDQQGQGQGQGQGRAAAEQGQRVLEEATAALASAVEKARAAEAALADVERLREEMARERAVAAGDAALEARLRESTLPETARERVRQGLLGRAAAPAAIAEAITREADYLARLSDLGAIRGLGYEKTISVGMDEGERLQKAMDQLFDIQEGARVPALSGIREAYVVVTRDSEVSGYAPAERVQEADTTTASFAYLLGTSMNKRLLKDYQAWPSEWQKFVTITPIKDYKVQDRIRLGAFTSLSTVAEDVAYTSISLQDTHSTYAPTKRGNLVAVTRETIINDDLYAIKQIPGKLAHAAAYTLAEFAYGLLLANGPAIYDTYKLFDLTHHANTGIATANLGTANSGAALSTAALQTAVTAMRRQPNMAGKPIGLKPRFLVVPPELEFQAMTIVKSAGVPGSNNNDINPMMGYVEVIVAPQITSPSYWTTIADPRVIDTIEIGFVGGQMNPQLFIQDQPLFGNNFTNDVITYKVRHEYGGAVVDYRGFYLGNT